MNPWQPLKLVCREKLYINDYIITMKNALVKICWNTGKYILF